MSSLLHYFFICLFIYNINYNILKSRQFFIEYRFTFFTVFITTRFKISSTLESVIAFQSFQGRSASLIISVIKRARSTKLRSQDRSHAASFQIHEVRADGTLASRKSDGDDCGCGHGVKFRGKSTESFHFRRENNSAPRRTAGGWSRGIGALWKFRRISAGNIMCCSLWFSFSLFPVNSVKLIVFHSCVY